MPVLLLLFVAMIVEITVLVLVGSAIGVLPTVALLVVASLVGLALLRREGTRTMASFSAAMRERRVPYREVTDGMMIALAGVLILVPGFVSDVLAIALLIPPTRAVVRRVLEGFAARRVGMGGPLRAARAARQVVVVDADFETHDDGAPRRAPTVLPPSAGTNADDTKGDAKG